MPSSYTICPVRFWEGDAIQFRWTTVNGRANKVSLIETQRNHQGFGACEKHGRQFVRPRWRANRSIWPGARSTGRGDQRM
ncbi:CPCC family cysteine-rich protein [Streptomyces lydicus]|uniref:CPCC family cysteine-rich protein n=1 Tax=Streptomyces lydicus TaxID=47763 RepID=UPI00367D9D8E